MQPFDELELNFWSRRKLPVVLQTEVSECGLACVCMIASFWGYRSDLHALRQRFNISLKGASLKSVIAMADSLGLRSRPLKLELDNLGELSLPCIIHWDMNHFVVLKSINQRFATIIDPAVGERRITPADLSKHFTGVALELLPGHNFALQERKPPIRIRSLVGPMPGLTGKLTQLFLLGVALQICGLIAPFYMQWVIDEALIAGDKDMVAILGIGFLVLALLQSLIGALRSWFSSLLAANVNFQWFGNAFHHMVRLPLQFFERRHTGDVVSKFNSITKIQDGLTTQVVEAVIDGVLMSATLIMMLLYSAKLAVIAIIAIIIYLGFRSIIFEPIRNANSDEIIHSAKQQSIFLESVRGIQCIRLFGRGEQRRIAWLNALVDQFNANLRVRKLSIAHETCNSLLFGVERVLIVWLAALLVLENKFSVGMLFAFISYKDQFSKRMVGLVDKGFDFLLLRLHAVRLADILHTQPEPTESSGCTVRAPCVGKVEFRNVSFRYSDSEPLILKGLCLTIAAGECIAITGPSGSGKTTAIKLLLGLITPSEGEILIGGIPLTQLGPEYCRNMLGTVMQEDSLFAGSIIDNISFFSSEVDTENVEACARTAAIHDDILAMPMAYNTLIGDIGTGLSGGQKQRILLARALYKRSEILVLDEATSHLDVWTEQAVNSAIKNIPHTRIIVAHRPETIAMAERVVVLQNGIVTHDTSPSCQRGEARDAS